MKKHPRPKSFAEVVQDVISAETSEPEQRGGGLKAPDGRTFYATGRILEPGEAVEMVAGGAAVAWDYCGSLGFASPLDWFEPGDRDAFVRAGPPVLRRKGRGPGSLDEWQTDDGKLLVMASYDVRWGRLMY